MHRGQPSEGGWRHPGQAAEGSRGRKGGSRSGTAIFAKSVSRCPTNLKLDDPSLMFRAKQCGESEMKTNCFLWQLRGPIHKVQLCMKLSATPLMI